MTDNRTTPTVPPRTTTATHHAQAFASETRRETVHRPVPDVAADGSGCLGWGSGSGYALRADPRLTLRGSDVQLLRRLLREPLQIEQLPASHDEVADREQRC